MGEKESKSKSEKILQDEVDGRAEGGEEKNERRRKGGERKKRGGRKKRKETTATMKRCMAISMVIRKKFNYFIN